MPRTGDGKERIINAGMELMRRRGYAAATVDEVCALAKVTKGAFFHHFASKEALGEACLERWDCQAQAMVAGAEFQKIADPVKRVLACMDFFAAALSHPKTIKSCLAGTTVQEISESNVRLRKAANVCFVNGRARFKGMLDEACAKTGKKLDTESLAAQFVATIQGSLILYKASQDEKVIGESLGHVRAYIESLLTSPGGRSR